MKHATLSRFASLAASAALALSLAACGSTSRSTYSAAVSNDTAALSSQDAGDYEYYSAESAAPGEGSSFSSDDLTSSMLDPSTVESSRKIVYNASVRMETTDYDTTRAALQEAVTAANGYLESIAYAPSLVRGQGYYTGMVFEVTCPQFSGAVAGGGRYDNMVGKFIGQQVPAVGFSIGFERVCGILLEQDYQIPGAKQKLALLYLKDADFAAVLAKADALRAAYDVTVLPQAKKLGKQFGTLEAAGYNAVAFADNDDIKVLGQKAE